MEHADVTRLEADIAIQFEKPTDDDLIVTRLSRLHVYPFASQVRLNGWSPRGQRLIGDVPMGRWETVTLIAGLRQTGIVAPMLIKGAMNGEAFLAYIERCLAPTLKRRDIVAIDNVSFHKVTGVQEAIPVSSVPEAVIEVAGY